MDPGGNIQGLGRLREGDYSRAFAINEPGDVVGTSARPRAARAFLWTTTGGSARASGSCPFTVPSTVAPGNYQLRLFANDGFSILATSNAFTVQ